MIIDSKELLVWPAVPFRLERGTNRIDDAVYAALPDSVKRKLKFFADKNVIEISKAPAEPEPKQGGTDGKSEKPTGADAKSDGPSGGKPGSTKA